MTETLQPDAPVGADQFRRAMRHLAGAVTVVATRNDDVRHALTATAVCALSAEPPRLLACINMQGRTFASISRSRRMSINVLNSQQAEIAVRFSKPSDDADFDPLLWNELSTGAPVLTQALMTADCRVENILMTGTHGIVIGNIVGLTVCPEAEPLLYYDAEFVRLESGARAA